MIRIITGRDEADEPATWDDFPEVAIDSLTVLDAIGFDDTDPALLKHLGVENFAEACWQLRALPLEVVARVEAVPGQLAGLEGAERDAREEQLAEEMDHWAATDRRFTLLEVVETWAAMRPAAATIHDVMAIRPRDRVKIADPPSAYLEAKKAAASGKGRTGGDRAVVTRQPRSGQRPSHGHETSSPAI